MSARGDVRQYGRGQSIGRRVESRRAAAEGDLIEAMSLFYVFYVFHARTCQLQQPYAGWPWAAGTPVAE